MFEIIVEKEGMEFLGWREVPTFPNVLGHKAVAVSYTHLDVYKRQVQYSHSLCICYGICYDPFRSTADGSPG